MIYQSGQRIEVIIKKEGGGGQAGAKQRTADSSGKTRDGIWAKLTGSNRVERQNRVLKTNATHALAISKQVLDLGINYYVGGVGMRSGDQALQDNVQRQVEVYKDVTGFASSVGMGALYGAWGGPIGAVLGATFGAVSTGTSLAVKYAGREREFNFNTFKQNNAIEYQRARANINLTTGRLR